MPASTKSKPKKRTYDATSRNLKTSQARATIINTFVKLLAAKRGGDVSLDDIVKQSGVPARTIYRLFNDREALLAATDELTQSFILQSGEQLTTKSVADFARDAFISFDRNENLVLAYLYSSFGKQSRGIFRKKFNQLLIQKILTEKKLTLTKEREVKLAVIIALINAKIWDDLRNDFGFSGEEIGDGVRAAIQVLLKEL